MRYGIEMRVRKIHIRESRVPYSMLPGAICWRIETSLQAAHTEARAAMDRQKTTVERVDGVLPEQHAHAAQIANLMADTPQEPVRAEGWTPVGAV